MSRIFWRRLGQLRPKIFKTVTAEEHKPFDVEFEKLAGMNCDVATTKLSDADFIRLAQLALKNVRRKRTAPGASPVPMEKEPMSAYA